MWLRRRAHRGPTQARQHRCQIETAVEAIAELAEVARQVFATGLMVRAMQTVLHIAEHGVEPLGLGDRHAAVATAGDDRLMLEAGAGNAPEAGQAITEDDGIGVEVTLGKALDVSLAKAFRLAEAKPNRGVVLVERQRGDERGLVRRAAPGRAGVGLTAPVDIIDFDDAGNRCLIVALLHHLLALVLEAPGGEIGDAEMAFELKSRDAVLLLGEQKHRQQPGRQRQLGIGEDGPGCERRLMVAVTALQERSGAQAHRFVLMPVARADEAVGPAAVLEGLLALFLGPVVR